jgi:hypothetical protein
MSTLQVNTIETNTPAGVLAVRDVNNALTAIQPGALRGTAAATAPVFQDSAGTQIGTLCRAWVSFNGAGTIAIGAAFNVASITDSGVGNYVVNFQTPFADTNYAFAIGFQRDSPGPTLMGSGTDSVGKTTSGLRVYTFYGTAPNQFDVPNATVSIFR